MSKAVQRGDRDRLVRLNMRFHEELFQASGHIRLAEISRTLNHLVQLYSTKAFVSETRDNEVLIEHEAITEAIQARDPDAAERAARDHMVRARLFNAEMALARELDE
jgi:DNA-binding GntR family transcriptional regulator